MRSGLATAVLAVLLLVALPPAAGAGVPPGFLGISPQGQPDDADYQLMEEAGVRSVRLPLFWSEVESAGRFLSPPDWSGFDLGVELAAKHGMRVMPFVLGSPPWIAPESKLEPATGWQLYAWASFLHRAVRRYGPGGVFWRRSAELPYRPIRNWEIWNEQNIVTFGRVDPTRFARLIRISGRVIHRVDRGARVILGGLFGRPLQVPPNDAPGDFLARVYRAGRVKPFFDGVALHPYVARARAIRGQIRNLRRIMRAHGDVHTPLYITELGWGSDGFESRWERGWRGQARELQQAMTMLSRHRRAWRIGGVWWFSWRDAVGHVCQFCDSSGLLTVNREAKPAWYRFNAWTGGDASIVPRAQFGR